MLVAKYLHIVMLPALHALRPVARRQTAYVTLQKATLQQLHSGKLEVFKKTCECLSAEVKNLDGRAKQKVMDSCKDPLAALLDLMMYNLYLRGAENGAESDLSGELLQSDHDSIVDPPERRHYWEVFEKLQEAVAGEWLQKTCTL